MLIAVLYTFAFALSGLCVSSLLFRSRPFAVRLWLGLALGLLFLTWLPSLFSFIIGFTRTAQILALASAAVLAGTGLFLTVSRSGWNSLFSGWRRKDLDILWILIPLFLVGALLFSSHILKPDETGNVSVGQVTYGDLAMHLGFISSIAAQGTFPPEYSIFPGHTVNYPFLCETSASSLLLMGANLRQAYLITALYAYGLVIAGVWFFFRSWLKTSRRAHIATLLFFLGGGFGFAYFVDLAKHGASLNTLLEGTHFSNFAWLLDGFYDTPTNLPAIGLRWVNPIVDMLIPQRATLFGWAFLFPCLYLLLEFAFYGKKDSIIPLGIISGLLPLIHTHSFLALGIISAVYCLSDLIFSFDRKRLVSWILYAALACIIGMPQLFGFAFRQVSESSLVRIHWNWANEADSYLWFYIKNLGWIFILLPFAFLLLGKRDRRIYCAPLLLWIISEIIVFQPNNYDNNKLLFIWFAFSCGLVAKYLDVSFRMLFRALQKRSQKPERVYAVLCCILLLNTLQFFSLAFRFFNGAQIAWYTICTLLLLGGLCAFLSLIAIKKAEPQLRIFLTVSCCCTLYPMVELLFLLWKNYSQTSMRLNSIMLLLSSVLLVLSMIMDLVALCRLNPLSRFSSAFAFLALRTAAYLLAITLSLSSVMTILREFKSSYQVYTETDLKAAEFVRTETAPDSIFLANSYHWNLITPLTGRSIVTGTSTFLYFHGIDNTQREHDVRLMYEDPSDNESLFEKYGVDYILVSNAELYNYVVDEEFFISNYPLVFENASARIYRAE